VAKYEYHVERNKNMGFKVQIQADYGSEMLLNVYPRSKSAGGKAVLAFLGGLQTYCDWAEDDAQKYPELKAVVEWYRLLEQSAEVSFCPICQALLDCMWGDGGDPTEYREDEYEFFRKRSPAVGDDFTEEKFKSWVRQSKERWKPIDDVMRGVQLLLEMFKNSTAQALEGFYEPEDTIPDFEALSANLDWLSMRGREVVRLNFN
jgi:hypothetical protein